MSPGDQFVSALFEGFSDVIVGFLNGIIGLFLDIFVGPVLAQIAAFFGLSTA